MISVLLAGMTRWLVWVLLMLSTAMPARAGLSGPSEEIAPGVFLLYSEFGCWKAGNVWEGFVPTEVIEMKESNSFGWRFRVRTDKDWLKLKVVLTLPAAPKVWAHEGEIVEKDVSSDGTMKLSADRRTSTTESEFPVMNGWVFNSWSFAEGDPVGDHVVRVYANEKLVRVFRFKVVPAKK
jgi:hypothetical protein